MRIPHGSQKSTPEPEFPPRVRFSSIPPSAPLFTFSVLEWTPASGLLAHLYPKRATSLQRLDNNASTTSTEEERRDPRDRVVFDAAWGKWSSFRQISCCGDVLVLEDAETIDVGPPRRHEYTWQQGPGRLPSVENGNTSFGATGGWRQTLASVAQNVMELNADGARHGTLISRPSHHRREIPLQDVHSIRRHVFKRPLPLTFNYRGQLSVGEQDEPRPPRSKNSHHSSGGNDDLERLEWRYELWGPVGVIFMLRGGAQLFLVFASGLQAEQIEELLIDFASGRGLQRQQPAAPLAKQVGSPSDTRAPTNLSISATCFNGADSSVSPGLPGSPAISYTSLRVGSPEVSSHAAPVSPVKSLANSLGFADHAALRLFSAAQLTSGASVISVGTPSLVPQPHPVLNGNLPTTSLSVTTTGSSMTTSLIPTPASTSASSRTSIPSSHKPPSAGYLYIRPWGEAVRYRRYYLRPDSASPFHRSLVRLSRHRLYAWQKVRQALGQEPRCVAMDVLQTYLTPSSTHENVFRVESVVDTYAQYKDVVPLGGAVATARNGGEVPSVVAARRRELELCRARPIVFEALAKTREERAEWLAWLQARGATVLKPEATMTPHMAAPVKRGSGSSCTTVKQTKKSFQPLSHQLILSSLAGSGSALELSCTNSMDRWVANCGVPSSSTEFSPTVDSLGGTRQQQRQQQQQEPHLPLKENDSERGSTSASLCAKRRTNSPMCCPQSHPHSMRFFRSHSAKNSSQVTSTSLSSPDPVATTVLPQRPDMQQSRSSSEPRHHHGGDFDTNSIVVEDDERDARLQIEKMLRERQQERRVGEARQLSPSSMSPNSPLQDEPDMLHHTAKHSRRSAASLHTKQTGVLSAAMGGGHFVDMRNGRYGSTNGGVMAFGSTTPNSLGEEGATTDHTLTGTGPTVIGDSRTPMYMEDTSSDEDGGGLPRPSPSPLNTMPGSLPHSKAVSVFSPSVLCQPDTNGGGAQCGQQVTNSYGFTPISLCSAVTDRKDKPTFDSEARQGLYHTSETPHRIATNETQRGVRQSSSGPSAPHCLATDILPLSNRPDTAVYSSDVRGSRSSLTREMKAESTPGSVASSAVKGTRAPTETTAHSRTPTAAPDELARGLLEAADDEDCMRSLHATPNVWRTQEQRITSSNPSPSPSPETPGCAVPVQALHEDPLLAVEPSIEASQVSKTLFSPTARENDGVQTRDMAECNAFTLSSVMLPLARDSGSTLDASQQPVKLVSAVPATEGESVESSGLWTGPETLTSTSFKTSPERKLDPRLSQFFTPTPRRSDSDFARGGECNIGSPSGPRVVALPPASQLNVRSGGNYSTDSFGRLSAVTRSIQDSPLPPSLPPRVGSLNSMSRHDTPIDGRLCARGALTLGDDKNGRGASGLTVLKSASSRATCHNREHLKGYLLFQSRDVMEQRKRAFRDSLFVNQD